MNSKVSVIVPVYNVEQFLRRCLDSLLAQTHTEWEAICVNDGTPDNSPAILEEYAQQDARFRIINKENGGLSDARNVGMQYATGEYLMFLDSDDFIHPQTMEVTLHLARKEGADMVTFYKDPLYRILVFGRHFLRLNTSDYRAKSRVNKRFNPAQVEYHTTQHLLEHLTEVNNPAIKHQVRHFYVWRALYRRSVVADVPFVQRLLFEDFPWTSEVALKRPKVVITQLPFYYYHPNFSSILFAKKRSEKIGNWVRGLNHILSIYLERATPQEKALWARQCMWPVVSLQIMKHFDDLKEEPEVQNFVMAEMKKIEEAGWLREPPSAKEQKIVERIRAW